ncbi:MAG: hypothetical protein SOZ86_03455, partial [Bacteroidaceae bacterium]|nr:hypothetical protein [Bacteroidaceae bacterium]
MNASDFCIHIPISVAFIYHRHRTDDCPCQDANVCNRHCKRYKPPMQTFATAVANVCGKNALFGADQGNG